jgi:hypothetical protein
MLRRSIEDFCGFLGISLEDGRRQVLDNLDLQGLEALRERLIRERKWDR